MHFFGVMLALAGVQTLVVAQSIQPGTVPRATRGLQSPHSLEHADACPFPLHACSLTTDFGIKKNVDSWCRSQRSSCPLLCAQQPGQSTSTRANECDPVRYFNTSRHFLLFSYLATVFCWELCRKEGGVRPEEEGCYDGVANIGIAFFSFALLPAHRPRSPTVVSA